MIRTFISTLLFVTSLFAFGQQALVDNEDGQWLIYNEGERILLDPSIHDLGNFDTLGFTYFLKHDQYGIINDQGEIQLVEKYKSVQQLGGGYYLLLDGRKRILASSNGNQFEFREILSYTKLQEYWSFVRIDTTQILFNTKVGKEWLLGADDEIYQNSFNYVYCSIGDTLQLFDPNGNTVEMGDKGPVFGESYLLLQTPKEKKIVYHGHEIEFPLSARDIRVQENEIMYSEDDKTTLISALDGDIIATFPYERISPFGNNLFNFYQNNKIGLITKSGQILVNAEYSSISKMGNLYTVRTSNGAGIIDQNGRQLVPCSYNYIRVFSDFFTVHNNLDLTGLISRKTEKTLLPCAYSSIMLSDTVVRAFASDLLRILELDSNHRIVNDLVLSNVTSLESTIASVDVQVDKRLFPLGWFIKNVPTYDKEGFRSSQVLKWGLKDGNDSILKPAVNKEPVFVENADFSLIPRSTEQFKLFGQQSASWTQFEVTSVKTGRRLVPEAVVSLDTTDLLSRNYARFVSIKGFGILLADNSILRVNYFDSHDPAYLRFCTSKKTQMVPAEKKDEIKVQLPDFDLNNDPDRVIKVDINQKQYEWIRFENAKWNYLDTTGKIAFSEPFEYAEPYKFETGIVKRDGRSGVVRADSIVIPLSFSSVNRSPISDTLFLVKRNSNTLRYLDTNGRLMLKEMSRIYRNKGNLAQVQWDGKKVVVSNDYELVSGETRFQKLMEDDLFYSKENKLYTIYDREGRQLGEVPLKPEEIWFDEYVLTKTRGKKGILSVDGDTLIPFKYKKIEKIGNYVFAENGVDNLLFNSRLERIDNLKTNSVLVDSITGQYAEIKTNKVSIYSSKGKRLRSEKGTKFEHFHNGYVIEMGKKLRVFGPDAEFTFDFEPKSLEVMENNGYLIEDAGKTFHYFDEAWNEVQFDEPLVKVKYVGAGRAIARLKTQTLLFGGDVRVSLEPRTKSVGTFQNGFLLTECSGTFQFINTEGINEFKSTYDEAHPFRLNYATVKENKSWTIIDRQGNYQILPNFDEITAESPTIFSTRTKPVYGLFDSHGNELIPAEFEQLYFLRNNIIQGRKGGDIFYFDVSGKPIVLE